MTAVFMPNTLISTPYDEVTLPSGWVKVGGYLLTNSTQDIEISADGGLTWQPVQHINPASPWAWGYWETCLYLPEGCHILVARALGNLSEYLTPEGWQMLPHLKQTWHQVCIYCI